MTSDDKVPGPGDDTPVALIVSVLDGPSRRLPPSTRLRVDAEYRDAMIPPVLQAHLPPEWDPEERPTRAHRRRDCDAESAAGRTRKSKAGRAEHCRCGARRPLTLAGTPDGDWIDLNSAVIAPIVLDQDPVTAGRPGFWRQVLWFLPLRK